MGPSAINGRKVLEALAKSLSARIPAGALVMSILMMGIAFVLTSREIDNRRGLLVAAFDAEAARTLRLGAHLVSGAIDRVELARLPEALAKISEGSSEVVFAAVSDADGKLLAVYPASEPVIVRAATADIDSRSRKVRHFVYPFKVESGQTHHLHLGLDKQALEAETSAAARTSRFQAAGGVVVMSVLIVLATLWLIGQSRRISKVAVGMKEADELVAQVAQELRASAGEILAVARRTEEQSSDEAAAVDETRRTMAALLDAASEIAESARAVAEIATESSGATELTADRIATLSTQAIRIGSVSDTIESIADKSELLALNAALEGARAGESGRGFVLVAAEMRRLAESVLSAAGEIKKLSIEVRDLSQAAVLATEQSQKLSSRNSDTAKRITLITSQQRSATEQVTESMNEIQQFTQQALSGSREAKATAAELAKTAERLSNVLSAE
ncbi:MAG: hypothetical protein HY791_29195 [Deltaproteobacteria bacterium]|nr:hypothetical protein [Deltaproteobacteria bacterium]